MIRFKSDYEWRKEIEKRLEYLAEIDRKDTKNTRNMDTIKFIRNLKKERMYENIGYELRNHHQFIKNIKDENGRIKPQMKQAIKKFVEKKINGERDYVWVTLTF